MKTFSVTEITAEIRAVLESAEDLQDVWVQGELSNLTRASSGHWYFSVKDASAQLRCVMFRHHAQRQFVNPRDGDEVKVHGYIGVYEARGEVQLYADQMQPVGLGDLYLRFEALKAKLQAEGLFDEARKRPIPLFPRQIGVVTSPTAAAFQDIQNVLRRRFPLAEVILSPTLVQGIEAPPQIIAALDRLNRHTLVDVILLCRGGGSIEDLWCFNDEAVARAVADSRIPVISGVGHEIDFTIVDFVADLRAPTPSAAAELATPNSDELRLNLAGIESLLLSDLKEAISQRQMTLKAAQRGLARLSPQGFVRTMRQRVDELSQRLGAGQKRHLSLLQERLTARDAALKAAHPEAILARGYAIVTRSEDDRPVLSEADASPGTGITIKIHRGELKARVEDKASHERYKRTLF